LQVICQRTEPGNDQLELR